MAEGDLMNNQSQRQQSGRLRRTVEFEDMQALVRFGHGHLEDSRFLLLTVIDRVAAGQWLQRAAVCSAASQDTLPETALQVAFTPTGLAALGLPDEYLSRFSEEFIVGMSGEESRSRRLGDIDENAPSRWDWGYQDEDVNHLLLLLYARRNRIDDHVDRILDAGFRRAFTISHTLLTDTLGPTEPFGFVDGISQPAIDWQQNQRTDVHARDAYSNLLAPGEIVLGYPNEYGQLTRRPLIDPHTCPSATVLPRADDQPDYRDLGRNGSYLVLRQLQQDVSGFWDFVNSAVDGNAAEADRLAASMVGRHRDGSPLVSSASRDIPGIPTSQTLNHFDYDDDLLGMQCPVGAHVRRSNPRTGDFPPGVTGLPSRIARMLGFKRRSDYEDLVASSRYHRLLRRGRTYGMTSSSPNGGSGLQFVCLSGNILRQFEFVQSAWSVASGFAGTREQRDPLLGHRCPLANGTPTDSFMRVDEAGLQQKTRGLPQFVTVKGGGYFFLPGLRTIEYLAQRAQLPQQLTPPTGGVARNNS